MNQPYLAVAIGGVLLVGDGPLIAIDGEPVLTTAPGAEGVIDLTMRLHDEDDALVATINENEWIAGDPMPWDLESDHQRLRIRSALYKVNLDIDARAEPIRIAGVLWRRGQKVELRPSGVDIGSSPTKSSIADLGLVQLGINLKIDAGVTDLALAGGQGSLVSEPDPVDRLVKSVAAFNALGRGGPSAIYGNTP